jgi:hypothetical protein
MFENMILGNQILTGYTENIKKTFSFSLAMSFALLKSKLKRRNHRG